MDQTKEFIERDHDIVFLGNLFLKGKPYTNPKEAVDKEYVDTAFDNITTENLKGSKIEDKNFPAFNGDLINKVGQNNFLLKETGIKPGKYHRLKMDKAGRVIGGVPGNYVFQKGDVDKISFDKINNKGKDSIYDWTNGFDSKKYLMINKDNVIDKPLAIKTKELKKGNTVLHENDIMKVSEQYFTGVLGDIKTDGQHESDNYFLPVRSYNTVNAQPDKYQLNFTNEKEIIFDTSNIRKVNIKDLGFYRQNYRPVSFVLNGSLYVAVIDSAEGDRKDFRIKLTENGKLPDEIEPIPIMFPRTYGSLIGDNTDSNNTRMYFVKDIMYFTTTLRSIPGNVSFFSKYRKDGDNVIFDEELTHIQTSDANLSYVDKKFIYIGSDGRLSWSSEITDTYRIPGRAKNLPGNTACSFSNGFTGGIVRLPIGSYIYMFYTVRSYMDNTPIGEEDNNLCYRVKYTNGTPYGEFETYELDGVIPEGYSEAITANGHLVIFTVKNSVWHSDRGSLYATHFKIEENGDITFRKTELLSTGLPSNKFMVSLSENSVFIVNWREIIEIGFNGVESSYLDKIEKYC